MTTESDKVPDQPEDQLPASTDAPDPRAETRVPTQPVTPRDEIPGRERPMGFNPLAEWMQYDGHNSPAIVQWLGDRGFLINYSTVDQLGEDLRQLCLHIRAERGSAVLVMTIPQGWYVVAFLDGVHVMGRRPR